MRPPRGALVRDTTFPALGHGRVTGWDGGSTLIQYAGDPTPRSIRFDDQKDVVRARLHPGHRVTANLPSGPQDAEVRRALGGEPDKLWRYVVFAAGAEHELGEDVLAPATAQTGGDARELLAALVWDALPSYSARAAFLRRVALWHENSFGIPPLLGARVVPLPHQLHAARRVLTDRAQRFVLADEVGLGKTIEAGLVAQSLAAVEPGLRVLVVAPGSMSRQWLCELFLRFGEQVFVHLDVTRLAAEHEEALFARPRVVVSTTALEVYPEVQAKLLAQRWDLAVVDEAHQVPPSRPLYAFLETLAKASPNVLLLSATPGKRDEAGLLGLMALVAPDAYAERGSLGKRLAAADRIGDALAAAVALDDSLEAGDDIADGALAGLGRQWRGLLPGDEVVADLVRRLEAEDVDAVAQLVAYVQEYHRIERRIIRTRRATVRALGTALCPRELDVVVYKADPSEALLVQHVETLPGDADLDPLQRGLRGLYLRAAQTTPIALLTLLEARKKVVAAAGSKKKKAAPKAAFDLLDALASDPGPADEAALRARAFDEAAPLPGEKAWLDRAVELTRAWMVEATSGCARFRSCVRWITKHLEEGESRKVLVFSQEREVVDELASALSDALGEGVALAFHHGLEDAQLSDVAVRFQQPASGCRVLVSDELGGEGRNFQIASAVVHLDQPWAVARLEQRIGRLDRIGRDASRPALSVVFEGPAPVERALLDVHRKVFQVYERSIGGLEFVLPGLQRQLSLAACQGGAAVTALRPELAKAVKEARARSDEAYERGLDASRRSLEVATEHAEVMADTDGQQDAPALAAWARQVGITVRSLNEEEWAITWSWEHLKRLPSGLAPPGITPTEGRVRRRGTFSRTKALTDESLELFAPGHPIVDALVRDVEGPTDGRCAVGIRDLGQKLRGRAFLVALARTGLDQDAWGGAAVPAGLVHRARSRLWPVTRSAVVELLPGRTPAAVLVKERDVVLKVEADDASARALDPDELAKRTNLAALLAAAKEGVDVALAAVKAGRKAEVDEAVERLGEDLREDIAFLKGLAAREPESAAQVERELDARTRLVASVAGEKVHLDALALVIGGP